MFSFKPWVPKGKTLPVRFYINGNSKEYLSKVSNKIQVTALTVGRKREIEAFLFEHGIDLNTVGLTELGNRLSSVGLVSGGGRGATTASRSYSRGNVVQASFGRKHRSIDDVDFSFVNKSQEDLYHEANRLKPSDTPFKDSSRRSLAIAVDHREPSALINGVKSIGLNTTVMSLDAGDVLVSDMTDSSRLLLIERKTITDLYTNISGENKHAHHQAERYYDMMVEYASEGVSLQVVWVVEGEEASDGTIRGLYNVLPQVKQVDGWMNYLIAVCGQYVVPTFNTNHTSYMIAKLAQGWVEKSLYYPVKVGNVRVDKSRRERTAMTGEFKAPVKAETSHRGVIRADDGLIGMLGIMPCINRKIAENLAKTGRTFVEIVSMTEAELKEIDGIGDKTAKNIRQMFDSKL
ncbi:hypothetical protein KW882_02360 [Vibrio parahaemolyticus]